MTEQQQPPSNTATPEGQQPPQNQPPAGSEKQPPWGAPENFDAAKAWELIENLRKEKGTDSADLRQQLADMKKAGDEQRDALARALGVKPEETSDTDKLAETVSQLQQQMQAQHLKATRLEVAAEHQIPPEFQGWLTATDADALKAQAEQLVPMVTATLAQRGLSPLAPGQPAAPPFAPNPGQGQNGGQMTPQQQSEAGYAQFYDPETGRPRF